MEGININTELFYPKMFFSYTILFKHVTLQLTASNSAVACDIRWQLRSYFVNCVIVKVSSNLTLILTAVLTVNCS
jgi:hypothetical protein